MEFIWQRSGRALLYVQLRNESAGENPTPRCTHTRGGIVTRFQPQWTLRTPADMKLESAPGVRLTGNATNCAAIIYAMALRQQAA